jgi:hypothetical protein
MDGDRAVARRRERLFDRWDANGGPDPLVRWWLRSPWRWLLAAGLVTAAAAALSLAFTGERAPTRMLIVTPMAVLSALVTAAGFHDEWLAERHPDGREPRALPSLSSRLRIGAQTVLLASLIGLFLLTVRDHPTPPDEGAIAEALFGADTHLRLLDADEPATSPAEVSTLETGEWAWTVATRGEDGACHVLRLEEGEVVDRGRADDPAAGCTAAAAEDARQGEGSSA